LHESGHHHPVRHHTIRPYRTLSTKGDVRGSEVVQDAALQRVGQRIGVEELPAQRRLVEHLCEKYFPHQVTTAVDDTSVLPTVCPCITTMGFIAFGKGLSDKS
jgi:hypothetical protein